MQIPFLSKLFRFHCLLCQKNRKSLAFFSFEAFWYLSLLKVHMYFHRKNYLKPIYLVTVYQQFKNGNVLLDKVCLVSWQNFANCIRFVRYIFMIFPRNFSFLFSIDKENYNSLNKRSCPGCFIFSHFLHQLVLLENFNCFWKTFKKWILWKLKELSTGSLQ